MLPGNSLTKSGVDERNWDLKLKEEGGFESFSDSALGKQASIVSEAKASSQAETCRIYTVTVPKLTKLLPSQESSIS